MSLLASAVLFASSFDARSQQDNTKQFEEFAEPNITEPENNSAASEPMSLAKMTSIIKDVGNNVEVQNNGTITFTFNEAQLIAVAAEPANRMRLIAPVIAASDLSDEQMAAILVSNYHLALDARYAVGDGILYSAYIHPLKELTTEQLISAIRQVATLRNTFGTSYSSGEMSFGIQTQERIDI